MAKRKRRRADRISTDGSQAARGTSLGDLLRAQGLGGSGQESSQEPATVGGEGDVVRGAQEPGHGKKDLDLSACGALRLRREKKRRAGKTVTLLQGVPAANLRAVARAMRRALGCGASVEGDQVVLQGDMTARAGDWLRKRGAAEVRGG